MFVYLSTCTYYIFRAVSCTTSKYNEDASYAYFQPEEYALPRISTLARSKRLKF